MIPLPTRSRHLVSAWLGTLLRLGTLLGLILSTSAFGQGHRLRFDRLSSADGLSENAAHAILQDSKGFIWIGTSDGLNRYDGYEFEVFRHEPADPDSLAVSRIFGLFEDKQARIWVFFLQSGVLNSYGLRNGRFRRYVHDPEDPESLLPYPMLENPASWGIRLRVYEEEDGTLWIGTTGGGINKIDPLNDKVERLVPGPREAGGLSHGAIDSIFEDSSGTLWIATRGGGLNRRLTPRDGVERFAHYRHDPENPASLSHDDLFGMLEDKSGALWIGTRGGGLNRLTPGRESFERFFDSAEEIADLQFAAPVLEDSTGRIWIRVAAGFLAYDPRDGRFQRYRHDPEDPSSLSADAVQFLRQDKSGALWFGTTGAGLDLYDPATEGFVRYSHNPADPASLSGDLIGALYVDRSDIVWIGTIGAGVSRYSRRTNKFEHFRSDPSDRMVRSLYEDRAGTLWVGTFNGGLVRFDKAREKVVERYRDDPGSPRDLGSDNVAAIYEDRRGNFWVGTQSGGLALVDRQRGVVARRYTHDPEDPASLFGNAVETVLEDSQGRFWVGGLGWHRFYPETGRFRRYLHDPADPATLAGQTVTGQVHEDRSGRLWIPTRGGISRFDPMSDTFTNYRHDPKDPTSLSSNLVTAIWQDEDEIFWIATYGGGLNRFESRTERFTHYTRKDGLPNDTLYSVLPDGAGRLWISSNQGLSRFDPSSGTFTNFDVDHGLQSREFNSGAWFKSSRGEMFFGGVNGFNVFHPSDIEISNYQAPVYLTAMRQLGRPVELDLPLHETEQVTISYRENYFSFEFAALDYSAPHRIRYAYKLEGFNDDWIEAGAQRSASYTNLDGGTYTFRVRATNSDGIRGESEASIRVIVIPPPWKRWWAYGLYVILALAGVTAYTRLRTARVRKEAERLRTIDRLKDEFHRQLAALLAERTAQVAERDRLLDERARLNSELEKRNADLARFNYSVAHDLKNPLTTIKNFVDQLGSHADKGDHERLRADLRLIDDAASNLRRLIDDLYEYSCIDRVSMPFEEVLLGDLVGQALAELETTIAARGVEVEVAADLPSVFGDRARLLEVMRHLLRNALHYLGKQSAPRIEVGVRGAGEPDGEPPIFFVRDNGMGIDPRYQDKVFGLFERLDPEGSAGTGIGLALVKRIVEVHGGKIWIESEGKGCGSAILFTLPQSTSRRSLGESKSILS